jgi:hypothetical protein
MRHGAADVFQRCESIAAILAASSAFRQVLLHLLVQFLQVRHRAVLQLRHCYDPRHSVLLSIFAGSDHRGAHQTSKVYFQNKKHLNQNIRKEKVSKKYSKKSKQYVSKPFINKYNL